MINCVRRNFDRNLIATASDDKTVKLLEFTTRKVIYRYSGETQDGSNRVFYVFYVMKFNLECSMSVGFI